MTPDIVAARQHGVSKSRISEAAKNVVEALREQGYTAELVGGCVRDLVLGLQPKDFDVATDARPEDVKRVFRRARLVGRRFRLAHVRMGREIVEVATYRTIPNDDPVDDDRVDDDDLDAADVALEPADDDAPAVTDTESEADENEQEIRSDGNNGLIVDDNVYGTRAEDAQRRDFTINALYYDPHDDVLIDYVNGLDDLEHGRLRVIGDVRTRFREDPVRMLRAIRFAAKLEFEIDDETYAAIAELKALLEEVPAARLFDEVLKLFHHGAAVATFDALLDSGLLVHLMPKAQAFIEDGKLTESMLRSALANTDVRVKQGKPVIAAFLFSVALWEGFKLRVDELVGYGETERDAPYHAAEDVIDAQARRVSIPRRVALTIREIWHFQARLEEERTRRPWRLMEHKRFRAAYDFYLLRAECGDADKAVADWWTRYQNEDQAGRKKMHASARESQSGSGNRRKRRRRKRGANHSGNAPHRHHQQANPGNTK